MTIFRHLSWISCNFCIFHRNRIISFMPMKSKFVFTKQIKEMAKICFNTLKIIVVKYGEIWFPWWNMVLCSTTCYYTRNTTDNKGYKNMTKNALCKWTIYFTNSIKCFNYTVGRLNVKRIDFVNIEIACETAWFHQQQRVPTRHFAQKTSCN